MSVCGLVELARELDQPYLPSPTHEPSRTSTTSPHPSPPLRAAARGKKNALVKPVQYLRSLRSLSMLNHCLKVQCFKLKNRAPAVAELVTRLLTTGPE